MEPRNIPYKPETYLLVKILVLYIIYACPEDHLVGCGDNGLSTLVLSEYNCVGSDVFTLSRQSIMQFLYVGVIAGSIDSGMSTLGWRSVIPCLCERV